MVQESSRQSWAGAALDWEKVGAGQERREAGGGGGGKEEGEGGGGEGRLSPTRAGCRSFYP